MRKVVASEFVSVDGVFEDPGGAEGFDLGGWTFKYAGRTADHLADSGDLLKASDALLLGRVTYVGFAKAWPTRTDGDWYADRMNSLPKYVVSSTLDKADWNNSRIIRGDVSEEVGKLKRQDGENILIFGSGKLVNTLMQHHLLDELRLLVHPVVLGKGRRLLTDGAVLGLAAVEARVFESGVVLLVYRPGH